MENEVRQSVMKWKCDLHGTLYIPSQECADCEAERLNNIFRATKVLIYGGTKEYLCDKHVGEMRELYKTFGVEKQVKELEILVTDCDVCVYRNSFNNGRITLGKIK